MKKSALGILAMLLALGVGTLQADPQEIFWQGVNTQELYDLLGPLRTSEEFDEDLQEFVTVTHPHDRQLFQHANTLLVESASYDPPYTTDDPLPDHYLWRMTDSESTARIPGVGDTAVFAWNTTQTSVWGGTDFPVIIDTGAFNPDHIRFYSTAWNVAIGGSAHQVRIETDLSIQSLYTAWGHTSANQGQNKLVVGADSSLTLTGANPIAFAGLRGGWGTLQLEAGAALRFAGEHQTFDSFNANWHSLSGNAGTVEFTNPGATIVLAAPGTSNAANIQINEQQLRVRSDQTWENPSGTGWIRREIGTDGNLVDSIDGAALHNLGNVAFYVGRGGVANKNFYYPEGTYQGLYIYGDLHYTRTLQHRMSGPITLAGGAVRGGDGDEREAEELDYSLVFHTSRNWVMHLQMHGHDLTTARGVHLLSTGATDGNFAHDSSRMFAAGSELDIGGELFYDSQRHPAGATRVVNEETVLAETRNIGIVGDADTVLTLRGSFRTNVRSPAGNGLHLATVNLVGGSANPGRNTWEVGSDPADALGPNTYAIGTLNIGTPTEAGHIRLVNEFINDGDPDNVAKDGSGEILIAGALNIHDGSSLDLDGQGVRVETALWISDTGTLDLNTGLTLAEDDIVYSFMGVGDQTGTWDLFAGRVIDSSNPEFTFVATTNQPNTYWQAIPEPGSVALLALGALAVLASRRRRG